MFKSGDASDPSNYRPISVLHVLSKIIERHVHDFLYGFLCENDLIYSRQSRFRKRHSTKTALIKIIDDLLFELDKNRVGVSGMVLVDYSKAFDMVDHYLLLQKLKIYRVKNREHLGFQSYLSNKKRIVSLSGKESALP